MILSPPGAATKGSSLRSYTTLWTRLVSYNKAGTKILLDGYQMQASLASCSFDPIRHRVSERRGEDYVYGG